MTSLQLEEGLIPNLDGNVAAVTGGASGIGLAAVKLLLSKGAVVHVLDRNEPIEAGWQSWPKLHYHKTDVASFESQRDIFDAIGPVHMVFANAAVAQTTDFFADTLDGDGKLAKPELLLVDINVTGAFYTVKLAWASMKRHGVKGSIVMTGSTTGFAPEAYLATYSALKHSIVGLVRSLRNRIVLDGITINAVAPAGTRTPLVEGQLGPLEATGLNILSPSELPALALVYSATASQDRRVETYGREDFGDKYRRERWNGRIIYVLGDKFTEVEGPVADLRPFWFGQENHRLVNLQQVATDFRQGYDAPRE